MSLLALLGNMPREVCLAPRFHDKGLAPRLRAELPEREIAPTITTIHIVLDNVRMHKGKQVQAWLSKHPRFIFHFPPVHCSWMNQVEQWFSILQRKRLQIADFADKQHLAERLLAFVAEWNEHAHPFQWSTKSVAKVMARCESPMAKAA
jgi:transposase